MEISGSYTNKFDIKTERNREIIVILHMFKIGFSQGWKSLQFIKSLTLVT